MNGLLPCPFCGAEFNSGQEPNDTPYVGGKFYIYHVYGPLDSPARKCKLSIGAPFDTMDDAREFWNKRASK